MKKAAEGSSTDELQRLELALPNNITTEMGLDLYDLSRLLDESSELNEDEDIQNQTLPPGFIDQWNSYLEKYGHRGPAELDIASPRYRDDPSMLFEQMRVLSESAGVDNSPRKRFEDCCKLRETTYDQICERLGKTNRRRLNRFKSLYRVWVTLGGYREMHKYCLIYAFDALRHRLLIEGDRLVKKKRLEVREQIFDLTIEDLETLGKKGKRDLVELGQANRQSADRLAQAGLLPALIDSRGEIIRPPSVVSEDGTVYGTPISTGVVRGRIKVLNTPDEKPLEYGEILVARATDPGWTPLFVNAAGLILEVGGLLQHGALVAREYGLPCVGGISGVTSIWEDGTLVEVDG
ncbi:MAG: hypothetical protein K8F91_16690, partial [Candidatus Obscuribacterales bacterium]|nr:hypothetical protein [Candidatus Obscuribacterales bacterium]